jgi:peptidyl-Lys metalloendopeptidase
MALDVPTLPRRFPWLVALLLLPLVAACAGMPPGLPQGALPPGGVRSAADIPGPACTSEHRQVVDEAIAAARDRMAEALRFIRDQPDHAHVQRWFGTAPRQEVAQRLARTADAFARPEALKLLCNDPPACQGSRMAYTAPSRSILGLCPGFFRARMEGYDSRWGTLIHEFSHVAAGTQDFAYGPQAAMILAKAEPARAAANADNYEYFVETLPR